MSQKFQIIALLAMMGSFGSTGAVQAAVPCETFRGLGVSKCFANRNDCYILAEDMLCHTKKTTSCSERTVLGPRECGPSAYTNAVYVHSCHWGPITKKIGEKTVVVGKRTVVVGKDKDKKDITRTEDITKQEDVMETKPGCIDG